MSPLFKYGAKPMFLVFERHFLQAVKDANRPGRLQNVHITEDIFTAESITDIATLNMKFLMVHFDNAI